MKYIVNLDILKAANKKYFSTKEREELSEKKQALPDGSFPIRNRQDLLDAIKSIGRAKDYGRAKKWIIKRAKELNFVELLPENWNIKKAGLSEGMTIEDIAKKHGVKVKKLLKQLKLGVEVEMEHTDNKNEARKIAMDHLVENANYYTKLKRIE